MLIFCLFSTADAAGKTGPTAAPLDTLRSEPIVEAKDTRYQGSNLDSSRKKLPDVQATVVPQAKQPSRPPRLKHPLSGDWFFEEARFAARRGDPAAVIENLKQARSIEPDNPRFQWWQASRSVTSLDTPTLITVLPEIFTTLLDSPVARGKLAVRLHQGLVLLTAWFWTLLVLGLLLGWWRNLAHDLGAIILRDRSHRLRLWLPLLIPLAFAALKPGWLGWLALMSVPLLVQTRGRQRALLAVTWVAAMALVFPAWPILRLAPPAMDPGSEVTLLAEACRQDPTGPISDRLRENLKTATDPDRTARLRVALAIQEARRGNFRRSDDLFRSVLKHDPNNFSGLVGLANNTYFRGQLDQALDRYHQARQLHPQRGEVGYNMAQVYFKKLFIPEATASLEESRNLGFLVPTHMDQATRSQGYSPVDYPGLSNSDLLAACEFEAGNYPPLVTLSSWQTLLGSPPLPLFLILVVPFLLAVILILWWSHQDDPRECENCGLALCRDCCRVRDNAWLCPSCGETASRSRSDVVLATLLKNRSRDEGLKNSSRIVAIGRLIPGAGHLASQRFFAAWFRISLAATGFYLISCGWAFDSGARWLSPAVTLAPETIHPIWMPLPAAMWSGWSSLPVVSGIIMVTLAWLIALLDATNLKQGIPERYSWAPPASEKITGPAGAEGAPIIPPAAAVGPGLQKQ